MVELFSKDQYGSSLQSSKGNQLKFRKDGIWYKTDYLGYEGLAEFVISKLLERSNLSHEEYAAYLLEEVYYRGKIFNGCSSRDFTNGWQLITLDRLFLNAFGYGVNRIYQNTQNHLERLRMLVECTERITGIRAFGTYMSKMITIDTFFLNEDRHAHNMAVMVNDLGEYKLSPFFDHGAGLLSDTTLDYSLDQDIFKLIPRAKPKTFCNDFDEQLEIAEKLYGQHIQFHFGYNDVKQLVEQAEQYPLEIRNRVLDIVMQRKRKYEYLFGK
ncbi:MAG: hypothetical protein IJ719_18685 [Clostridia bacterium]|nr:hypothetical protein [Clostridia bacterium]